MPEYGKKGAWKNIGKNCIVYGTMVFGSILTISLLLKIEMTLRPDRMLFSSSSVYLLPIALALFTVLSYRHLRKDIRACSFSSELAVAILAVITLGFPITALGLLILGVTYPDYDGVDKWLPEIKDRSKHELSKLQEIIYELELSKDVEDRCLELLEISRDRDLMNRPFNQMLGAMVYISARENKQPRTLEEISEITNASKKDMGRAYRDLARELDIPIRPPMPEEYLEWFGEKLSLDEKVQNRAKDIIEKARGTGAISGKSSKGIAATALYIAAHIEGEERSMKEIGDILDVTTITIRNRGREIVENIDLDNVPSNLKQSQ